MFPTQIGRNIMSEFVLSQKYIDMLMKLKQKYFGSKDRRLGKIISSIFQICKGMSKKENEKKLLFASFPEDRARSNAKPQET